MNRLAPLIVRRPPAATLARPIAWDRDTLEQASDILDDLRLFATGWLGGLVFFGTFLA